jgi:hypothetical protein
VEFRHVRSVDVRAAVALVVSVLAFGAAEANEEFGALKERAVQEASHGEGMRYANFTKHYLLSRQEEAAKGCVATGADPNAKFEMLVWMAKDGTVERARVEPETPVSTCVATAVVGTRVPAPDKVPWVVLVEWDVSRE